MRSNGIDELHRAVFERGLVAQFRTDLGGTHEVQFRVVMARFRRFTAAVLVRIIVVPIVTANRRLFLGGFRLDLAAVWATTGLRG